MANLNNQGKSPEKYENSAKVAWYTIIGMVALLVILTLLGGCSTTKKVDKCCESKNFSEEFFK